MKISKQELIDMIRAEAKNIKSAMIQESDAVTDSIDVFDVDMNSNDELGDSEKALTYKDTSKKVEKEGEEQKMPKMNSQDDKGGSDEKSAVAVKVDAGAKKGGDSHTAGQAKANFTSKKDIQDTEASGPFDERVDDLEMNSEDKLVDEKAKTYVAAGESKGGKTHTSGQAKADVHERMPEEDAKEPTERIAAGIEIDGSNIDLKETYTKKELKNLILTEAKKAVVNYKENLVKTEKTKQLMEELSLIKESLEEYGESLEIEEGLLGKVKYAMTSGYPKIEKLVSELDKAKEKNPEGYKKVEAILDRFSDGEIKKIKPMQSDDSFPFTKENFMALAGFHNFNITVIRPVGDTLPFKVNTGVGKVTGHSR